MKIVPLDRCRVVLVRPHFNGNLGSVARVMKNFGLAELVLVAPIADRTSPEATMMAVHGADVLAAARVVETLAEAVADCGVVVATSGEVGGLVRKGFWGTPAEQLLLVLDALPDAPAAVVFGPEPSGLTVDEIAACHAMIFIPAAEVYPSLNLAQAVAVVLYELRCQWLACGPATVDPDPPANFHDQGIMFARLREGLTAVRYLWDHRADGIFHVLRQLIVRAKPTGKDLKILHGLAGQLLHVAKVYGVTHPRDGRPPGPAGCFGPPER